MSSQTIYFDNAATTRVRREVLDAMVPYFLEDYGNPASIHSMGRNPRDAMEAARKQIASLIGAKPQEIYFTAGGSEADNWAIKSAVLGPHAKGKHLIVSAVEHHAIISACEYLEKMGIDVTYVPVDGNGRVDPADVEAAIRDDTALVSVMTANNEIGTIEPIAEIGAIARKHGVLFHTDAVQAYGQIPLDVVRDGVDLLSASAHKLGGPKGIGFLYIRDGVRIDPLIHGGGQERGIRGGTSNVPGIVGFGKAAEIAARDMDARIAKETELRDHLIERVLGEIPYSRLNGDPVRRLPGNANFSFDFVEGESLLMSMNMAGVCVSTGSACASGSLDPSHVLLAIGLKHETAHGSMRFSVSYDNTMEEVDRAVDILKSAVDRLRSMSPLYEDFQKKQRNQQKEA